MGQSESLRVWRVSDDEPRAHVVRYADGEEDETRAKANYVLRRAAHRFPINAPMAS
jgi:hypothetical protein